MLEVSRSTRNGRILSVLVHIEKNSRKHVLLGGSIRKCEREIFQYELRLRKIRIPVGAQSWCTLHTPLGVPLCHQPFFSFPSIVLSIVQKKNSKGWV